MQHFLKLKDYTATLMPETRLVGVESEFSVELPHGMRVEASLNMRERRIDLTLKGFERGGALIGATIANSTLSIGELQFSDAAKLDADTLIVVFHLDSVFDTGPMFSCIQAITAAAEESVPLSALIRAIGDSLKRRVSSEFAITVSFFKVEIWSDVYTDGAQGYSVKTKIEYSAVSRAIEIRVYHDISQLGRAGPPAGYYTASRAASADMLGRVAMALHVMAIDCNASEGAAAYAAGAARDAAAASD